MPLLPTDPKERKKLQLFTFMFHYFPKAWLEVVRVARVGNEQHNPGEPLHWARGKSTDQMNAAFNHIFDYGGGAHWDDDGCRHLAKAIWRLSAQLQLDCEATEAKCERIADELIDAAKNDRETTERVAEVNAAIDFAIARPKPTVFLDIPEAGEGPEPLPPTACIHCGQIGGKHLVKCRGLSPLKIDVEAFLRP